MPAAPAASVRAQDLPRKNSAAESISVFAGADQKTAWHVACDKRKHEH